MNIYDFSIPTTDGQEISMSDYKGKVLLIVNTASNCGFTPQYEELQKLYDQFGNDSFEILGFPCNQFGNQEPGSNTEISSFCTLNFGVTFPILSKIEVNGPTAHPLYTFLQEHSSGIFGNAIKWNFTKFLIDAEGNVVKRFAPTISPAKIKSDIEKLIQN